jgi:segregation and condensation protein B
MVYNNPMNLSPKIEALLFWKAEPVSIKKLAELLKIDQKEIGVGLDELEAKLKGSGLTLVRDENDVMLGTAKEYSSLIEEITKEEIGRDLGKAGLETLSIILYQGPISRSEIDYIRGVNSQFIIRNLLVRGLIDRVENPGDARIFLYKPTLALLSHLGVGKVTDLPEYNQVREEIENFKKTESNQSQ